MTIIDRSLRMFAVGALVGIVIGLSSCSASQAAVGVGETCVVMGDTFSATGSLFDDAQAQHIVSDDVYRSWAVFAKRFKAVYLPACDAWRAFMVANMPEAAAREGVTLAELNGELHDWGARVVLAPALDGGVP